MGTGTADVLVAIASIPTRIATALASVPCIVVIGVSMVAAVPTMTGWRISSASRRSLGSQGLIQESICRSTFLCSLDESSISRALHILVFLVRRHQCIQLLAHLSSHIWTSGDLGFWCDTVKQLRFNVFAQCTFIRRIALLRELFEHVSESGI